MRPFRRSPASASSCPTGDAGVARLRQELIARRLHAEVTQAELAARMGTTQSAVARLEAGTASAQVGTLDRWADALGLRLRIEISDPPAPLGNSIGPLIGVRYPYPEPVHLDPRAALARGLPPAAAVIGPPGSGKTALLRSLAAQLYAAGTALVTVTDPREGLLSAAALDALTPPAGTPRPRAVHLTPGLSRDQAERLPGRPSRALEELTALHGALAAAVVTLPDTGGVVLIEETSLLTADGGAALLRLLRLARSRRVGLVLGNQRPDQLADPRAFVSQFLLLGADDPASAAASLELCGAPAPPQAVRELRELNRTSGGPRLALLSDLDGRRGLIIPGWCSLPA